MRNFYVGRMIGVTTPRSAPGVYLECNCWVRFSYTSRLICMGIKFLNILPFPISIFLFLIIYNLTNRVLILWLCCSIFFFNAPINPHLPVLLIIPPTQTPFLIDLVILMNTVNEQHVWYDCILHCIYLREMKLHHIHAKWSIDFIWHSCKRYIWNCSRINRVLLLAKILYMGSITWFLCHSINDTCLLWLASLSDLRRYDYILHRRSCLIQRKFWFIVWLSLV